MNHRWVDFSMTVHRNTSSCGDVRLCGAGLIVFVDLATVAQTPLLKTIPLVTD